MWGELSSPIMDLDLKVTPVVAVHHSATLAPWRLGQSLARWRFYLVSSLLHRNIDTHLPTRYVGRYKVYIIA